MHGSWAILSLIDNSPKNVTMFKMLKAKDVLTKCILSNPEVTNKAAKAKASEVVGKLS